MTYLDAAFAVLQAAKQPLHYAEITRRALEQGLIVPTGLTPEATMGSRLYTDTQEEGSRFVRAGKGRFDLAARQRSGIDDHVAAINQRTRQQLGELLHTMPAKRFEELVMQLLLKMGFDESTLQVTPYSGDGGIDVTGVYRAAGLTEVNVAVQAKRWKGNVQAPTVTSLRGSLQVHQQGIIITTSDFSSGARKEAIAPNKTHITLINSEQLIDMLINYRVGVIERTLTVNALDEEWWGELLTIETTAPAEMSTTDMAPPLPIANADAPARTAPAKSSTAHKPSAITLLGTPYPVKTWKDILITVCTILAERHPAQFAGYAPTLHGHKRQYISSAPDAMYAPAPIPGTALYVETNLSARHILQLVDALLAGLGYPTDQLEFHLPATNS